MNSEAPEVVVIIAAGMGTRLKSEGGPPKPLLSLNNRPLILRVMDRFKDAGVLEAIVVIGYRGDEVRAGVLAGDHSMKVSFVNNPNYKMNNGLSVLAAEKAVGDRTFFLSMADHVFESSLIEGLARVSIPADGLILAVDKKLAQIYDEDDATKVRTEGDRIVEINKHLDTFDAVDTGLFACTPMLFKKIREAAAARIDGDCSLSDGVKALSNGGVAVVHDIGNGKWQDVDTPGAVTHAEKIF